MGIEGTTDIGMQLTLEPTNQALPVPTATSVLSVTGGVYVFNSVWVKD